MAWRRARVSMWSRKPTPVVTPAVPPPSTSTVQRTSVSFVRRSASPRRPPAAAAAGRTGLEPHSVSSSWSLSRGPATVIRSAVG